MTDHDKVKYGDWRDGIRRMSTDLRRFSIFNRRKSSVKIQATTFEDVYAAMGGFTRYQATQIALIFACTLPMAWFNVRYPYIARISPYACNDVNESTAFQSLPPTAGSNFTYFISYEKQCEYEIVKNESGHLSTLKTKSCPNGYNFSEGTDFSIMSEWGLVCDKQGQAELSLSLSGVGGFLGFLVINFLADKVGRWKVMTGSLILSGAGELAVAFAPSIYAMYAIKLFTGFVASGMYICASVLAFELVSGNQRVFLTLIAGVVWSGSVALCAAFAYAFKDSGWRVHQLYSGVVALAFPFLFIFFINESPSWLLSVGKKESSEKIVKQACRINNIDYDREVKRTFDECFEVIKIKESINDAGNKVKSPNVLDLFRHKQLVFVVIVTLWACIANEVTNQGLYLNAQSLAGDLYLNSGLLALSSLPSYFAAWGLMQCTGRKLVIILFMLLTGVSLLISTFVRDAGLDKGIADNLSLVFYLFGKFAISGAYNSLTLYIPENYPTSLRATGSGLSSSGAPLGDIISPYLITLSAIKSWSPGVLLSACCFLTAFSFLKMPETKGKKLAASLADYIDSDDVEK